MEVKAQWKHKIYGFFQKQIIKSLLNKLKPEKIFTNADLYQHHLNELGYKAEVLPLYSNIINQDKGVKDLDTFCVVFFGTIYSANRANKFISDLKKYCLNNSKILHFKFIGRNGHLLDNWVEKLKLKNIEYSVLGELNADDISYELNKSHLGVSTTPRLLYQKSGVFSAYQEHGLKIFILDNPWDVKEITLKVIPNCWFYTENIQLNWNSILSNKIEFNKNMYSKEIFDLYASKITSNYV